MYDTAELKLRIDIRELAAQRVTLRRESVSEVSGPCPKCGGEDRFHCQATWFFCRQCHPERGDAIEYTMWLHDVNFKTACEILGAGADAPTPERRRPVAKSDQPKERSQWKSDRWQQDAIRQMETALARLGTDDGARGRKYLLGRGLEPEVWKAWKLGYEPDLVRNLKVDGAWVKERLGPAITLPWTDGRLVKALQFRLLDYPDSRYWQKANGDRTIFGAHLVARRRILVVCEGELNAVSFWQVGHEDVDVVSYGPQDNIEHASPYLRKLASRYDHVLIWADEPAKALEAVDLVGCGAVPAYSPRKKDSNDLLREGVLADVFALVLENTFGFKSAWRSRMERTVKLIHSADSHPATVHGSWRRLDDGRIEASYTPAELLWARAATGYEPTTEELALMAAH